MTTRADSHSRKSRSDAEGRVPAKPQGSAVIDGWLREDVHDVTSGLSKSLFLKLRSHLKKQSASINDWAEWERLLAATVPMALEDAFVKEFLGSGGLTRRRRVLLAHLLSTAELRSLEEPVVAIAPQRDRARKIAEAAPEADEVTSEEAAKLLHVSRTHLNTLVDEGKLGRIRHTQGGHRRIERAAVLAYKEMTKAKQKKGLARTAQASERMGLYDKELEGLPVRRKS